MVDILWDCTSSYSNLNLLMYQIKACESNATKVIVVVVQLIPNLVDCYEILYIKFIDFLHD